MSWPNDADGDVLRELEASGFDFGRPHSVDFMVDFESWPPAPAALGLLRERFGEIEVHEPDDEDEGYVLFKVEGMLSYESVTSTQRNASALMDEYGGYCDSWGVLN